MPGIWVSPFVDREHGAQFAIKNFGLSNTTMSFIGNAGSVGLADDEIVRRSWALDDLDSHYGKLATLHRAQDPQTGAQTVQRLLDLDADLQHLPLLDPQLPMELAPQSTSRDAARELLAMRAAWLEPAREYWSILASDGAAQADESA
jgi:DNA-binding transcriptional regulator PaaX